MYISLSVHFLCCEIRTSLHPTRCMCPAQPRPHAWHLPGARREHVTDARIRKPARPVNQIGIGRRLRAHPSSRTASARCTYMREKVAMAMNPKCTGRARDHHHDHTLNVTCLKFTQICPRSIESRPLMTCGLIASHRVFLDPRPRSKALIIHSQNSSKIPQSF